MFRLTLVIAAALAAPVSGSAADAPAAQHCPCLKCLCGYPLADCPDGCPVTAAATRQMTYAEVYARVARGEQLILGVGPYRFGPGVHGWVEKLPGVAPGFYHCFLENGRPSMVKVSDDATPSVVVPGPTLGPVPTAPRRR